ncbi:MAG: alkaline phosphatase family protein [Chloroflexi bacterium]|nr:alkaline phosphatase family protein [Chloroflexota bacterium]
MSDLTEILTPSLYKHRLPNLDLGDSFVYPYYEGRSILNIPASISQLFGAPRFGGQPLIPDILEPLGENLRNVIFILMDALALHRLQRWLKSGELPVWQSLIEDGIFAPLTSITPSTTSAALTTLWTGRPASWHGVTGYEMWLKEYGIVANMIEHKPITYQEQTASLQHAGFSPENFLPPKNLEPLTLGTHLNANRIKSHAFQHYSIANSGLSRMFMADTVIHPFKTPADLWVSVRQLLESHQDTRKYVWVYWGEIDGLSHYHGPDDERPAAEFSHFTAAFDKQFLSALTPEARTDTLVILGADHGQITTHIDSHYDLKNHPNLRRRLHINPTGENRLAYLYVRPRQTEAVREYIERNWPNQFAFLASDFALHNGLFGPGEPHPEMLNRLGDLILFAKGEAYLWWGANENPLIGRHGGLTPEEMLVPFLAARLD